MAGSYPDAPGDRIAYDRDGTVATYYDATTGSQSSVAAASLRALNDESTSTYRVASSNGAAGNTVNIDLFFPEPRDLVGMFVSFTRANSGRLLDWYYSTNATSPTSGSWTATGWSQNASGLVSPNYRSDIGSFVHSGVKAVRLSCIGADGSDFDKFNLAAWHLYAASPISKLQAWDPVANTPLAPADADFGDAARSTADVLALRIKNTDTVRTADNILITMEALTEGSPSILGQHRLSWDNAVFTATLELDSLAPGEISPVLYVQRNTLSSAQTGPWAPRLVAVAGTYA